MTRIPHPHSEVEIRQGFQRLTAQSDVITDGASGEILVGAGVGVAPTWSTELTLLTKVTVDNITIDAATIISDTGAISFGNENLTTTGTMAGINVTSGADPGHTHTIYLLADGSIELTGNMTVTAGITIDGRDISVDGTALDTAVGLQHAEVHAAISHSDITSTGAVIEAAVALAHAESHAAISHSDIASTGAAIDAAVAHSAHNLTTDIDHATITGAHNLTTDIDHDQTTNYDANKHIDHSGVSVTAGDGLTGGGTIAATRTIDLAINKLSAVAIITSGDYIPFEQISPSVANKKITFANFEASFTAVDEKVKIDVGATAGYLGAAAGDGVLRTGDGLSYVDGGDYVTLTGGFSSRARAYPASAQDIVTGTWTQVTLGTEDFDNDGEFASSTFTATSAGRYLISAGLRTNETLASNTQLIIELRLNDAPVSRSYTVNASAAAKQVGLNILDIWEMSATDTVKFYVWHDHGANREMWGTGLYTFLAIHRLS